MTAETVAASGPSIDAQNPWPGLSAFDEASARFFGGRDDEAAELVRLVGQAHVGLVFGKSGLGKTSLLQAGLFPRLRRVDIFPVYLRLNVRERAGPLVEQLTDAMHKAFALHGVESFEADPGDRLWEQLHDVRATWWSAHNRPLLPLLVLDQFEEVFTLGAENSAAIEQLRLDLADLIENRIPARLAARSESGAALERLDLRAQRYKLLLCFREDFLPDIEAWRRDIPSLMRNRLRLLPMSAEQARRVVCGETAGGRSHELVDDETAREIVRFVAAAQPREGDPGRAARRGAEPGWDRLEIEPALLSLVASGLNERRRALGQNTIDAGLLRKTGAAIVGDFYERCVADMAPATRRFIEDELITEGGFRNSYPLDDALEQRLIGADEVRRLVDRRLLRIEHQLGVDRLELIHDRLTEVVREHRDRERERLRAQRARRRWWLAGSIGGTVLVGLGLVVALFYGLWRDAEDANAKTRVALNDAERANDRTKDALLQAEQAASEAQRQRGVAESATQDAVDSLERAKRAGQREAIAAGKERQAAEEARSALRTAVAGKLVLQSRAIVDGQRAGSLEEASQLAAAAYRLHAGFETLDALNAVLSAAPHLEQVVAFPEQMRAVGPEGRVVVTGTHSATFSSLLGGDAEATLQLWDAASGRRLGEPMKGFKGVPSLAFARDGRMLATAEADWVSQSVRMWSVPGGSPQAQPLTLGTPVQPLLRTVSIAPAIAISPDGRQLAVTRVDRTVRIVDVTAWREEPRPLIGHREQVRHVAYAPDGHGLLTGSDDGSLRWWDPAAEDGSARDAEFRAEPADKVSAIAVSRDGRTVVSADETGHVRLWDRATRQLRAAWTRAGALDTLVFAPDDGVIVAGDQQGFLYFLDSSTLAERAPALHAHAGPVRDAVFVAGPALVTIGSDGTFRRWSPSAWAARRPASASRKDGVNIRNLALGHADGAFVGVDAGGRAVLHPAGREVPVSFGAAGEKALVAAITRQDGRVLTLGRDGSLQQWDPSSGVAVGAPVQVTGSIDLAKISRAAASRDGLRLALGGSDGSIWIIDAPSGKVLCSRAAAAGNAAVINGLAFSPDGRLVAAGSVSWARVWTSDDCRSLGPALAVDRSLMGLISDLALADGGRTVLAAAGDAVMVWDGVSGSARKLAVEQDRGAVAVAMSSDSKTLIAGGKGGVIRFWDVASGQAIGAGRTVTPAEITALAFTDDQRKVVWGDAAGNVDTADAPAAWIDRVCSRLVRNMGRVAWRTATAELDYVEACRGLPVP